MSTGLRRRRGAFPRPVARSARNRATPSAAVHLCAVSRAIWPGGVNERTFTWSCTGAPAPARHRSDSAARPAQPICASSSSVAGNTGRRGESGRRTGVLGASLPVADRAGHAADCARPVRRDAAGARARHRPVSASRARRAPRGHRSRRPGTSGPGSRRARSRAFPARARAGVGDGLVVAVLDDGGRSCCPGPRAGVGIASRSRAPPPACRKPMCLHHPGRELSDRLGHPGTAGTPRCPPGSARGVPRSPKAGTCSTIRSTTRTRARRSVTPLDFASRCALHDQLANVSGREEARDVGDLHRRLEAVGRHFRQVGAQLRHADVGDDAAALELGFGERAARVLDDLPRGS